LFIETHPNPAVAKSDGANMLSLNLLEPLLEKLIRIRKAFYNKDRVQIKYLYTQLLQPAALIISFIDVRYNQDEGLKYPAIND
jgi:hypothetical protein